MKNNLEIIYQDDDLIIVNKPAGLLTIPDRYNPEIPSVLKQLRGLFEQVFIVHRLDRETSGVMCFAKNAAAHRNLSIQFEHQRPTKIYWALVEGILQEKQGIIDAAIAENTVQPGLMLVHQRGKNAISHYEVKEEFRHYSILHVSPKTGRTHQIRVHLAHIGFPMAVDVFYGQKTQIFLSEIKQRKFKIGKYEDEQPILSRVPLHALSLKLLHPTTNQELVFSAELPKDLRALQNQLSKWDAARKSEE